MKLFRNSPRTNHPIAPITDLMDVFKISLQSKSWVIAKGEQSVCDVETCGNTQRRVSCLGWSCMNVR